MAFKLIDVKDELLFIFSSKRKKSLTRPPQVQSGVMIPFTLLPAVYTSSIRTTPPRPFYTLKKGKSEESTVDRCYERFICVPSLHRAFDISRRLGKCK